MCFDFLTVLLSPLMRLPKSKSLTVLLLMIIAVAAITVFRYRISWRFQPQKSLGIVEAAAAAAGEHSGGGGAQRPDYKTHELFAQKNDD